MSIAEALRAAVAATNDLDRQMARRLGEHIDAQAQGPQSPHRVSFAPEPVLAPEIMAAPPSPSSASLRAVGIIADSSSPRGAPTSYLNFTQQSQGSLPTTTTTNTAAMTTTQRSTGSAYSSYAASSLGRRASSASSVGSSSLLADEGEEEHSVVSRDSAYVLPVVDQAEAALRAAVMSPPPAPAMPAGLPTMATQVGFQNHPCMRFHGWRVGSRRLT